MKKLGLLALFGMAAGAFAYWKYKNLSPEEKENLKNKVRNAKDQVKDAAVDIEETLTEEFSKVKNMAKDAMNGATAS